MKKSSAKGRDPTQTCDWLTTPIEFEEERSFRIARKAMRAVVVLATIALLWAAATPIRELSLARGQLMPLSQIRPVKHLEGGVVEQILVNEGDIVDAGLPLVRLNAAAPESELTALQARAGNLMLLKERVEALLAEHTVHFADLDPLKAALADEHRQVYQSRLDHRVTERALLLARIAQRRAEVSSLVAEIVTQRKLLGIEEQQREMRQRLVSMGTASKKQLLDVETALEQARARLQSSEGKLDVTRAALVEAEAALAESDAEARKLWSEELVKASAELLETQETIRKHVDRVERLTVRAPTRGQVQQLLQRSPSEVVRPGETIAQILPLDDALIAEVRLKPDDIAAVKIHDKAELKVTAYDSSKYGKISGRVTHISPTTFEDENKNHYYKVLIHSNPLRPGRSSAAWQLQPGMTVDAEIVSGSKTLLQYFLKPIFRGVDTAFTER
jgi:adhesin transport system membrane fusion protein